MLIKDNELQFELELQFLSYYYDILTHTGKLNEAVKDAQVCKDLVTKKWLDLKAMEKFFNDQGNIRVNCLSFFDKRYLELPDEAYLAKKLSDREKIILYAVKMAANSKSSHRYIPMFHEREPQDFDYLAQKLALAPNILNKLTNIKLAAPLAHTLSVESQNQIAKLHYELYQRRFKHSASLSLQHNNSVAGSRLIVGGAGHLVIGISLLLTGIGSALGLVFTVIGAGLLAMGIWKVGQYIFNRCKAQKEYRVDLAPVQPINLITEKLEPSISTTKIMRQIAAKTPQAAIAMPIATTPSPAAPAQNVPLAKVPPLATAQSQPQKGLIKAARGNSKTLYCRQANQKEPDITLQQEIQSASRQSSIHCC